MNRRYDDLLHRAAADGLASDGLRADLAALCATAVHDGVSATLIGVLCDDTAPAVVRDRALAAVVGRLRDLPAPRAAVVAEPEPGVTSGHAALV